MIQLDNNITLWNVRRVEYAPPSYASQMTLYEFRYSGAVARYTQAQWDNLNNKQRTVLHELVYSGFAGIFALKKIQQEESFQAQSWRNAITDASENLQIREIALAVLNTVNRNRDENSWRYTSAQPPERRDAPVPAPALAPSNQATRDFYGQLANKVVDLIGMGSEGVPILDAEQLVLADMSLALHALSQGSAYVNLPQHDNYNHNLAGYVRDHFSQLLGLAQRVINTNPTDTYLKDAANAVLRSTRQNGCPNTLQSIVTPEAIEAIADITSIPTQSHHFYRTRKGELCIKFNDQAARDDFLTQMENRDGSRPTIAANNQAYKHVDNEQKDQNLQRYVFNTFEHFYTANDPRHDKFAIRVYLHGYKAQNEEFATCFGDKAVRARFLKYFSVTLSQPQESLGGRWAQNATTIDSSARSIFNLFPKQSDRIYFDQRNFFGRYRVPYYDSKSGVSTPGFAAPFSGTTIASDPTAAAFYQYPNAPAAVYAPPPKARR